MKRKQTQAQLVLKTYSTGNVKASACDRTCVTAVSQQGLE